MTMSAFLFGTEDPLAALAWRGWPVLLAPFVGSFLGVLVLRHDRPASILTGRSECPRCGVRLSARDLVPLLSWAAMRGRCRHCGHRVGLFYPAIELAATGIALWAAFEAEGAALWISCGLGWALLALAATDLGYFLLPDFLTLPLAAAGLAVAWTMERDGFEAHLLGAIAGLSFIIALHYLYRTVRRREGIGLGDAKLFAAAGAWVGWIGLPSVMLLAALSGLIFAAAWALRGRRLSGTDRVPLGAFLCLGLWIVWLYGPLGIG
jgi:leader peptidase (prepilin peptidase)/N-methyltransferase